MGTFEFGPDRGWDPNVAYELGPHGLGRYGLERFGLRLYGLGAYTRTTDLKPGFALTPPEKHYMGPFNVHFV